LTPPPLRAQSAFSAGHSKEASAKLQRVDGSAAIGSGRVSTDAAGARQSIGGMSSSILSDGLISDPLADAANNFIGGFTQSETSTAW
jgi:hypothetical protein